MLFRHVFRPCFGLKYGFFLPNNAKNMPQNNMLFRPVFRPCFGLKYGSFLKPEVTPNASKMQSKIVPRKRSVPNLMLGRRLSTFGPLQPSKMSFSPRRRAYFRCVTCSPFSGLPGPKSAKIDPKMHPQICQNASKTQSQTHSMFVHFWT